MRLPALLQRRLRGARGAVPADLRRLARALRSVRGDGPTLGLPSLRRTLVVSPHPDDETIGCGGTMALLADDGCAVSILTVTDGEATRGSPHPPAEIARRRRAEAERAAEVAGASVRFLGFSDGGLSEQVPELSDALAAAIDELEPDAVFAPWLLDGTSDHRAVSEALARALGDGANGRDPEIWGYEVWTALVPNRLVEVTSVIERKREALSAHETASLALDLSAAEGLGRWRTLQGMGGQGWAEAFLATSADEHRALASELQSGS